MRGCFPLDTTKKDSYGVGEGRRREKSRQYRNGGTYGVRGIHSALSLEGARETPERMAWAVCSGRGDTLPREVLLLVWFRAERVPS